jgi:lipoprotein-anchoring transpeptidase ErfK/SrfK
MRMRAAATATVLLIGLAGMLGEASAQYYPAPPPPRNYPAPTYRPLPPVEYDVDDTPAYDLPSVYGRPLPPPGAAPQQYGRRAYPEDSPTYGVPSQPSQPYGRQAYPEAGPYGAQPPASIYREEAPPRGYDPYERQREPSDPRQRFGRPGVQPVPESQDPYRPPLSIGPEEQAVMAALPPEERPETGPTKELPPQFRRTMVDYRTREPVGTLVIDTQNTYLYLVLGNNKAMRYGIGVGREGFTWAGAEKVSRMAEWPDWHPPAEMIERQPYLPRFMAGGPGNPMGARALYLGKTLYRIHGTNQPSTIGSFVSSGCIRLTNEDVADLYTRVQVGSRVVVLPGKAPPAPQAAAAPVGPQGAEPAPQQPYNPLAPPRR